MYLRGEPANIQGYIMGGQIDADDYHRALFDKEELSEAMRQAGLSGIRAWAPDMADCSWRPFSLNLEGFKGPEVSVEGVVGVMSLPRLAFTDNMLCVFKALVPHKVNLITGRGVFWGHAMTNALEDAIAAGAKYALTIDYDTIFTRHDVADLYALMELNPEAFSICAVQSRRDGDTALFTLLDANGEKRSSISADELNAELLPIESGHFGLTMIRLAGLAKLPRPWFQDVPGPDGRWQEGRIDEDVQFWKQANRCGLKIFQANRVVVGHMQQVISWPTRSLRPLHQYHSDYEAHGMPRNIAR
jgi:hypothetical protein